MSARNMPGIIYLVLLLVFGLSTYAFKYGAPPYICKNPFPVHGTFTAQTTPSPFILSTLVVDKENGIVKVQISSRSNSSSDYFTGYLLRIKDITPFTEKSIGTGSFTLEHTDGNVFQCQDEPTSAVTHDTNSKKRSLEIKWQAPPGFSGDVVFTTSIVVNFTHFWVKVESSPVTVNRKPLPFQTMDENQPLNTTQLKMLENCGIKKNCLYTPDDCISKKSCDALLTIVSFNDVYEIEMFSKDAKFVALGISSDFGMGADAISECVFEDPNIRAYRSWNVPRRKTNKRQNDHSGVKLIRGLYENGLIYCKIHIKPVFEIDSYKFDLNKNWYYLTLASGREIFETNPGIKYHDKYRVSPTGRFYLPVITDDPDDEFFYNDCGNKTVCHGAPGTCLTTKNCRFAVKVTVQDHKFNISMLTHRAMYVAVGFTEDQRRGNDHIVECEHHDTKVQAYRSWNVPDVFDNARMGQTGVELMNWKITRNGLQCQVIFDPSVIPSFKLDLDYYFILAGGSTLRNQQVGYHNLARSINDASIGLYTNSSRVVRDKLFYIGCAESRTCFGYPDGCVATKSCDYAVSIAPDNVRDIFSFHIVGNKSPGYVAVGLSDDKIMGDDLVVECMNLGNGKAQAYLSYNEPGKKSNKRIYQNKKPSFFMPTYGSFNDGKLECIALIEHPHFTVENKSFDLLNDKYYLMLVVGKPTSESRNTTNGSLYHHNVLNMVSSHAQALRIIKLKISPSRIPIYIHSICMIISWIGLSSIGIIVARYYKTFWNDNNSVLGHWFQWHKYCMISASVLTTIGVVVIYFYCGRIIIELGSNHAILGLITAGLAVFQPIAAVFRPTPKTSTQRILFHTIHWFVGNALHTVAIFTIFLAVDLTKARLPELTYWILAGYAVHYILIHLFLTTINDVQTENEKEIELKQEKNGSVKKESQRSDKQFVNSYWRLKDLVFKYHLAVTILLVLLMIILIFSNEFF